MTNIKIDNDITIVSESFNHGKKLSPFLNAGIIMHGRIFSSKVQPSYSVPSQVLGDIIDDNESIEEEYFISEKELYNKKGWAWHKNAKAIDKVSKSGHNYTFKEGKMEGPDALTKPSRTIITSEGGKTPSRIKHIITIKGRYRRLTTKELDKLSGFPGDWTKYGLRSSSDQSRDHEYQIPNARRAFLIGNALVVGCVTRIGSALEEKIMI